MRALIERFGAPAFSSVVEQMPEEMALPFQSLPEKAEIPPANFFISAKKILAMMHPSWYEEMVAFCPPALQPAINGALGENGYPPVIKQYLLTYLVRKWPDRNIQSVDHIPETPLRFLLDCDEQMVLLLAQLLAVHDIVDDVRKIVDKKLLQQILRKLSTPQQKYLKTLLQQPAHSLQGGGASALKGLKNSKRTQTAQGLVGLLLQDPERGSHMLYHRGLSKLAEAVNKESSLFLWHILHRLEHNTALAVQHEMEHTQIDSGRAKKQLLFAYQFLKRLEQK